MCEHADPIRVLRAIPFKIAALETVMQKGSYELSLVSSVYAAVLADTDYVIAQLGPRDDTSQ
jgi:hypothetical protein